MAIIWRQETITKTKTGRRKKKTRAFASNRDIEFNNLLNENCAIRLINICSQISLIKKFMCAIGQTFNIFVVVFICVCFSPLCDRFHRSVSCVNIRSETAPSYLFVRDGFPMLIHLTLRRKRYKYESKNSNYRQFLHCTLQMLIKEWLKS